VAKLRFDNNVIRSDIDAAIALMRASQSSIEPELQRRTREDPVSRLYMVSSRASRKTVIKAWQLEWVGLPRAEPINLRLFVVLVKMVMPTLVILA